MSIRRHELIMLALNSVMAFRAKFGWPVAPDMMQLLNPANKQDPERNPPVETPSFSADTQYEDYTKLREEVNEFAEAHSCSTFVDALIDILYYGAGLLLKNGRTHQHETLTHRQVVYQLKYDSVKATKELRVQLLNSLLKTNVTYFADGIEFRRSIFQEPLEILRSATSTAEIAQAGELFMHLALDVLDALNFNTKLHFMEVHEANMRKEVATPERPSSRGFTANDAVKPEGWVGPDHDSVGY